MKTETIAQVITQAEKDLEFYNTERRRLAKDRDATQTEIDVLENWYFQRQVERTEQ